MLKKFLLLCFVIMAFGIVPSIAETIGPVQPSNVFTVDFKLPDDLQGAVYLDMTLDYPRDVFLFVPTDSISDDRIVEYDFNNGIPAGKKYSPQFLVLPSAADGTYTINLLIHGANDRKAEDIEGLTVAPCTIKIGPLPSPTPTPTHKPTAILGLSGSSDELGQHRTKQLHSSEVVQDMV